MLSLDVRVNHFNIYLISSYTTDGIARYNSYYGSGSGPIWLDDVACSSYNTKLLQCSSSPIGSHHCSNSDEAGVKCEGNEFLHFHFLY